MATSNDTTNELTRNQIIEAALRKLGVLAIGQTPETEQYTNGQIALNALISAFQALGMHLWARKDYTVTLVASQRDYTIGVGQTINTPFPLKIQTAILELTTGGAMRELVPMAYQDFRTLNTESVGIPVNYTYQPKINLGVLSLWPMADSTAASNYTLQLTYQRPFEGFTASTETPDFPQEWQLALIYNLAMTLAPEYGIPLEDRRMLQQEAKMHLDMALSIGNEESSLYWQVERY